MIKTIINRFYLPYPYNLIKKNKAAVEDSLQKYFKDTPYHSFEIEYSSRELVCCITSINNKNMPIDLFIPFDHNRENISTYCLEYDIKESELLNLFFKFNYRMLIHFGIMHCSLEYKIKFENGKLSYHFKDRVID